MLRKLSKALLAGALALSAGLACAQATGGSTSAGGSSNSGTSAQGAVSCHGTTFNPMSDMDWNLMYPITIMGVRMGGNSNPAMMYESPVCVCPGPFGIPSFGIGITYWQPMFLTEIERSPGCLSTMGGQNVAKGYDLLHTEKTNDESDGGGVVTRMQVHHYVYPVFWLLDMFKSMACKTNSGFALAYMSEYDYTWQDDAQGGIFNPEAALFTSPEAQAACALDAVSSSVGFPLDPLFWCAGTWGGVYPLTGNSNQHNSDFQGNNLVLAKFIARMHRWGLMWQTIGPTATCFAHPNPVWIKSQYRYNQVWPIPRRGSPVVTGSPGLLQYPPVTNTPTRESTATMIWQGQQCCARLY